MDDYRKLNPEGNPLKAACYLFGVALGLGWCFAALALGTRDLLSAIF